MYIQAEHSVDFGIVREARCPNLPLLDSNFVAHRERLAHRNFGCHQLKMQVVINERQRNYDYATGEGGGQRPEPRDALLVKFNQKFFAVFWPNLRKNFKFFLIFYPIVAQISYF